MNNKYIGFIAGFLITLAVVIFLALNLGGQSDNQATDESADSTESIVEEVGVNSEGLENNGDLPKIITQEEIERANPFDSY